MKKIWFTWGVLLALLAGLSLAGCSQGEAAPSVAAPTLIVADQATAAPPAETPTAAEGVATASEVTVAATLPPPPTTAPLPTNTAPPEATATPTEEAPISAADFGPDRNPLTGETVDPANLLRRPLAIKLSNSPPQYTRPQSGLNDADLVFEHTTEGSITRFTAIFYGHTPEKVGPIRSARLIDLELPAMYDAALIYSGSSVGVGTRLFASDFAERIVRSYEPGYYRTGEDKPYEHTLYGIPLEFWRGLEEKGLNTPPEFVTFNTFSETPPPGGVPASKVTIDYNWTIVDWVYDPTTGRYLRWSDGEIHRDGNTLEQVTAANVVYVQPFHILDPTICEQINDGVCGHLSVQIHLWDTGGAVVFRDGQRYDVQYHRIGRNDSLTFTDYDGNPFPLKVGNTWVQVVPSWVEEALTVEP